MGAFIIAEQRDWKQMMVAQTRRAKKHNQAD